MSLQKPRVIFINRFFFPDHSATSQMLSDLAFSLAEQGYSITVITSQQRYDDATARLCSRERVNGVEVVRIWTSRFGRSNLFGRSFDYLSFYLSAALSLLRRIKRGDVVVSKTDPPMLSLISTPLCHLRGAKAVNWLQDLFPEVADALGVGHGRLARGSYGVMKKLRNASLRSSQHNIAIGGQMASRLRGLGIQPDQISTLPNWADGQIVQPVPPEENALRAAWGLTDSFVVAYSGNLGRAHEIATILGAMKWLQAHTASDESHAYPKIHWLFIGAGALMKSLQEAVFEAGLTNVMFQPYQPRELMSQSLSVGDVHLVSLRPELEGLIVPSKYYGIAAAGRPTILIGDLEGEIARLLAQTQAGVAVACGDGCGLANAIINYRDDTDKRRVAGANARAAFESQYDLPAVLQKWDQLLVALMTEQSDRASPAHGHAPVPLSVRKL